MTRHPLVAQAKAMLMQKYSLSEPEAHKFINKEAMNNGTSMVVMAKRIIRALGGDRSKNAPRVPNGR